MKNIHIEDHEVLFRRVPNTPDYIVRREGMVRISSQAFSDRYYRPSVDRAILRENNPKLCQQNATDAVVSIIARDVRGIEGILKNNGNEPPQQYIIDIEYVPIENVPGKPDNIAHAEIFTDPICDKNIFRKLKERLAQLANLRLWDVDPPSTF
ncbi:hypothetical protein KDW_06970 [Dictyobacter vulcani]|uniref:Uncharacterized protein n=1 Tax=Dictyobacter vulcani TaxID=2607529 RepID=A0A5J4KGE4_9CHLR|nr:hypothetical protein [Dictyobacter vulcani]GER86535.1 hypothetical protein KDW_06970 [Dictyobacter vulcani]